MHVAMGPVHVVMICGRMALPAAVRGIRILAAGRWNWLSAGDQPAAGIVERVGHGVWLEQVQVRPRPGDLLPDPVNAQSQPLIERSGDHQDIGICRAGCGRPPPLSQFPFHNEPDAGTTRHFDQEHVRAIRGHV